MRKARHDDLNEDMTNTNYNLYDYDTAEAIRPATEDEFAESVKAGESDGGAGVILVADQGERRVYVA